ncbi:MAG: hypothetical protein ACLVJX_11055 [Merdibacter sp.]
MQRLIRKTAVTTSSALEEAKDALIADRSGRSDNVVAASGPSNLSSADEKVNDGDLFAAGRKVLSSYVDIDLKDNTYQ